jgi:tRNA threonylcarbamoyladenosine biosynthesis protein TsaB
MKENLLHLETSSTVCSVALSQGRELIALKEINEGFSHAENLHLFVADVINQANLNFEDLNGIAVSKGPGSYTGLRIGVSAAKGYALSLEIPLISVDTLQTMAYSVKKTIGNTAGVLIPMIDARRNEIFSCVLDPELNYVSPTQPIILDHSGLNFFPETNSFYFFGSGAEKSVAFLKSYSNAIYVNGMHVSAENMIELALNKFRNSIFEDVAYFEPFYLKEFYSPSQNQKVKE